MVVIKTVFIEPDNIKKQILMSNIIYKKKKKVALINFLFMSYCKQYSFFKEEIASGSFSLYFFGQSIKDA